MAGLSGPGRVGDPGAKLPEGGIKFKLIGQAVRSGTGSISKPEIYNVYEANVGGKPLKIHVRTDTNLKDISVSVKHVKGEGLCAVVRYTREGKEPMEINIKMKDVGKVFVDIDKLGNSVKHEVDNKMVFKKEGFTPEEAKKIARGPEFDLKIEPGEIALKGVGPDGKWDFSWMEPKAPKDTQTAKPTTEKGPDETDKK